MKTRSRILFQICLLAIIIGCADVAFSAQCNVTTTALNFGNYDPLSSAPTDSSATVNITCRTPARNPQVVTFQLTSGGSGTPAQRSMLHQSGGGSLFYNIYSNPGRNQIIGDGSGGSTTFTRTVDKTSPWSLQLYGRIDPLQVVPVGLYSDTIIATILW